MENDRVYGELHAAPCGEVNYYTAWDSSGLKPNSSDHNKCLSDDVGTVRVPWDKETAFWDGPRLYICLAPPWTELTWERQVGQLGWPPSGSLFRLAARWRRRPAGRLGDPVPQTPPHLPGTNWLNGSDERLELRPLVASWGGGVRNSSITSGIAIYLANFTLLFQWISCSVSCSCYFYYCFWTWIYNFSPQEKKYKGKKM